MRVSSLYDIRETGLVELVGINEQVDQNEYSGSVAVETGGSGAILSVLLVSTESGSGSVQTPAGKLLVFDADPNPSAGDAALAVAEWGTLLGFVDVASADWVSDASGAAAYIVDTPVAFHRLDSVYLVWLHQSATSFNDAAGDDERLQVNCWIRQDT